MNTAQRMKAAFQLSWEETKDRELQRRYRLKGFETHGHGEISKGDYCLEIRTDGDRYVFLAPVPTYKLTEPKYLRLGYMRIRIGPWTTEFPESSLQAQLDRIATFFDFRPWWEYADCDWKAKYALGQQFRGKDKYAFLIEDYLRFKSNLFPVLESMPIDETRVIGWANRNIGLPPICTLCDGDDFTPMKDYAVCPICDGLGRSWI